MTVGLDCLLFLNNSIPTTDPAIKPDIGPNGESSLLFHVHPKRLSMDSHLNSYGSKMPCRLKPHYTSPYLLPYRLAG